MAANPFVYPGKTTTKVPVPFAGGLGSRYSPSISWSLAATGMSQALVAFGHHMQIVDIARLGKLGGIQKVAAKLLGTCA